MIKKIYAFFEFALFYIKEVIKSNFIVAYDVLTPTHHMKPAFMEVNVEGMTDRQLLVTANLITMTPGTLSIDINKDRTVLCIHGMYVDDAEADAKSLEQNYLRRVRYVF